MKNTPRPGRLCLTLAAAALSSLALATPAWAQLRIGQTAVSAGRWPPA